MDTKVLVATIAVLAVLVIGVAQAHGVAEAQLPFTPRMGGMGGMMASDAGMPQMMGGMDMGDMRQMHAAMGEYFRSSNAPAEMQEMHAGCGKMMGW